MKRFLLLQIVRLGCLAFLGSAGAAVRYVNVNSASPSPPYINWTTAATVIQDAVDVALAGDEIFVTNGIYQTGGRAVYGVMTNRVAVTKPLTVRSVNGPEVTVVRGYQVPGMTNGPGAVRCVYLTNGAALVGFTLTNGATGVWHQEGDDTRLDSGGGTWCESLAAVMSNCVLTGNSASIGGGASAGTLNNCVLTGNSALAGGGTAYSTLNGCTLSGNSAQYSGGGAFDGTLSNCTLTGNLAYLGGGAYYSTLHNCVVTGNSVPPVVEDGNLTSFGAPLGAGGGVSSCTLNNCTLSGNSASFGGGAYDSTLNNCIVYHNAAARRGPNYSDGSLNYCCTTPLPSNGIGNITAEPELVSASHIAATSPCRGAGSRAYVSGMDIDGEPWANPPSIGCDEVHPGSDTGPLTVAVQASFTNVATGFEVNFIAQISGHASASRWEFGDATVVSNRPYASHAWLAPGDYPVVLRAYNQSFLDGISAIVTVHVVEGAHYVAAASINPVAPYTSWATAANTVQDAVDVALPGAEIVVTNGVYQTGGRAVRGTMINRVAVTKPLTVRSVNGPDLTVIRGYQVPGTAVRCVYLTNSATLVGFTLTNGAVSPEDSSGGGVRCESPSAVVSNCVLSGNSADVGGGAYDGTLNNCTVTGNSAQYYGGTAYSTLNNCTLTGNSAQYDGGGAYRGTLNDCILTGNTSLSGGGAASCTLNNCTLTGNSAQYYGGGAYDGTLNNCTVYYNNAKTGPNYYGGDLNYSCTTPLPPGGQGNFTNAPLFLNQAAGDLRLQSNSPCINAGRNIYAPAGPDLDGNPRIVGGNVDIGAYEFQSPAAAMHYVNVNSASPSQPYINWATAATTIQEAVDVALAGDEIVVTNGVYQTGGRSVCGVYGEMTNRVAVTKSLTVRSVNGPQVTVIRGYQVPGTTNGPGAVRCVYLTNGAALVGFTLTNGATLTLTPDPTGLGLNTHQKLSGGGVWCESTNASLSNCVLDGNVANYGGGAYYGTLDNCAIRENSAVRGGGGAFYSILNDCTVNGNRALYGGGLHLGALNNCSIADNSAEFGGGTLDTTLNNCTLSGNSATTHGGGSYRGTLNNCTLSGNAAQFGGGACGGTLNNCTLTGNWAASEGAGVWFGHFGGGLPGCNTWGCWPEPGCNPCGPGAEYAALNNCIVYDNTAPAGGNYPGTGIPGPGETWYMGSLNYCCTMPLPLAGEGNITNAPLFFNQASGNLRLQSNSPCINAGRNAYPPAGPDLDGNPRIVGGTVDIGAYEFQSPQSALSYAWLQQYGLATDGSADIADPDGDGLTNFQEWRAGTDPTNSFSVLRLLAPVAGTSGVTVRWQSVSGRAYFLERSIHLGAKPGFAPLGSDIVGELGITVYSDTNAVGAGPFFYRVGVKE